MFYIHVLMVVLLVCLVCVLKAEAIPDWIRWNYAGTAQGLLMMSYYCRLELLKTEDKRVNTQYKDLVCLQSKVCE